MKRLFMAVAALMISATLSLVSAQNNSKEPFAVDFQRLDSYLELQAGQRNDIAMISDYFIEMQAESLSGVPLRREERMTKAINSNLKLMKEVLNPEQYRKYLTLLNVTNNNNRIMEQMNITETYLVDNK